MSGMSILICELVGTALLVLLGDGVCMNINLNKSGQKGGGACLCGIGWGLAVMVPAFIFGKATGAHFNPAVTIALAVNGSVGWGTVPFYLIGEMVGGFIGASILTLMYHDHLAATPENDVKRGCYCTAPSIRNTGLNFLSEFIDTFICHERSQRFQPSSCICSVLPRRQQGCRLGLFLDPCGCSHLRICRRSTRLRRYAFPCIIRSSGIV